MSVCRKRRLNGECINTVLGWSRLHRLIFYCMFLLVHSAFSEFYFIGALYLFYCICFYIFVFVLVVYYDLVISLFLCLDLLETLPRIFVFNQYI